MADQQKVAALIAELPQYLPSSIDLSKLQEALLDPSVPDSQIDAYKQKILADPSAATVEAARSDAHTYVLAAQDRAGEQARQAAAATQKATDPVAAKFGGFLPDAQLQKIRDYVNQQPAERRQALVDQLGKEWTGKGQGPDVSAIQSPADQASALVSAGRDFNFWHLMTDDERAATLPKDIVGYVLQGVDTKGINLDQLKARLGGLTGGQLWRAVQNVRGQIQKDTTAHPNFFGLLSGSGMGTGPNIQAAINTAVQALPPVGANAADVANAAALKGYQGPQQAAAPSATTAQPGQPATQEQLFGKPNPADQANLLNTNTDYLASMMGVTQQQLQQQYQSYTQAFQTSLARLPQQGIDIMGGTTALPMNQWVDTQLTAMEGAYKPILDYYAQSYAINYGGNIPPELMTQLRTAVKNAPPDAQAAMSQSVLDWQKYLQGVTAASGATAAASAGQAATTAITNNALNQKQAQSQGVLAAPTASLPSMPFLEQIVSDYQKANPAQSALDAGLIATLRNAFQGTLGRQPTADEIAQYKGSDSISVQAYIAGQTVAGTNLTYGHYDTASTRAKKYWNQYFGHDPTKQDIQFTAGFQDEQQLQDWVYKQPSHLKGTNIGQYTALHDAGDKVSQQLWNTPGSSGLTATLASAMAK